MSKWEINEASTMHGPVLLRAWRGYGSPTWYAAVHLQVTDMRVYVDPCPEVIGYGSRADAQRVLRSYAAKLGPVEPILALVRFFGAARGHMRARRAA